MTTSDPVVSVRHVSKRYCHSMRRSLRYGLREMGREAGLRRRPNRPALRTDEFWAVDDVTFDVQPGEAMGLVGANGSGKSTLLRVMHGLTKPDAGEVVVRGRHGGLLDLGSVFDPLQTGRENVLTTGSVLGMSRRRLSGLLDPILDFAGIGDFVDAPVQTYSSGMKTRLAFATAVHLDLDLMLIDETLIAGDLAFRRQCVRRVLQYVRDGGSLVLVDHDLWLIQAVCTRCAVLADGKLVFVGPAHDAIGYYVESQLPSPSDSPSSAPVPVPESGLIIEEVRVSGPSGGDLVSDRAAVVELTCQTSRALGSVRWGFVIVTGDQVITIATELMAPGGPAVDLGVGHHTLTARIDRLPLIEGTYRVRALVVDHASGEPIALAGWEEAPAVFRVRGAASDIRTAANREVRPTLTMNASWDVPAASAPSG